MEMYFKRSGSLGSQGHSVNGHNEAGVGCDWNVAQAGFQHAAQFLPHKNSLACSSSWKRPKNGSLVTWPKTPHKMMQIKRFKSLFTWRTLMKVSRPSRYAYSKNYRVSEGCNFTEARYAILSLQWWSWQVCPGERVGLDTGSVAQKEWILAAHA